MGEQVLFIYPSHPIAVRSSQQTKEWSHNFCSDVDIELVSSRNVSTLSVRQDVVRPVMWLNFIFPSENSVRPIFG